MSKVKYLGYQGLGPQNLGRGNLMQGLGPNGKETPAYQVAVPKPQPQPIDPAFEQWKAQAGLQTSLGDANAAYQNAQTAYQTGYNADGSLNTSNPYSQAALLQETYNRATAGTTNSYAAQGQFGGAVRRMQNENARNYSIGSNQLQNAAQNQYHNTGVGQATNAINNLVGGGSEGLTALLRSLGVQV